MFQTALLLCCFPQSSGAQTASAADCEFVSCSLGRRPRSGVGPLYNLLYMLFLIVIYCSVNQHKHSGLPSDTPDCHRRHSAKVEQLRTAMADAHATARDGDLEALNTFIAAGSNLNQRDKHSRTPLHLAAWAGKVSADMHVASCSIFIPAPPWAATYWPLTCLLNLQAECVEALLKAGCDLKAVAQDETSALHFAAQTGRTDVCRILLNAGESHAARFSDCCLQWQLALRMSAVRVCAGLKVNLRTRRGFTPLHNAAKGGAAT